jgi:hypothetical protein
MYLISISSLHQSISTDGLHQSNKPEEYAQLPACAYTSLFGPI